MQVSSVIDLVAGWLALAYFLMISAATKQHFKSEKYPLGMYVISAVSLIGLFTFLIHAFFEALIFSVATLAMMIPAFVLFIWAAKHSQQKKLSLAFDDETKIDGIITSGPWAYVRHPFYVSYILFWLACAVGTTHPTSIAVSVTLLFIYGYSAIREEGTLKESRYGDQYLQYRKNAGFFLPKFSLRD
jgi:protein-S-isoprenylcysteine O-methyltransferase Ste14